MAIITHKNGTLEYLTAQGISAPHCFTTRHGGVSTGHLSSLNLGVNKGDTEENVRENFARLGRAIGFDPENLVMNHQIHSDIVRVVTKSDHCGINHHGYPEADALITRDPGTALLVFTADCTPILLHDPVTGAVGAVHAGWRGVAQDLAGKTVAAMCREFGSHAADICAAIGPNIGVCCFQTDADVPQAMVETYGPAAEEHIHARGDKFYVNLKEITALALRRCGVTNIEISGDCTMCQHETYWSHRYTKGIRGSHGAIIVCKEAAK